MPNYQYKNKLTGEIVERICTVEDRDKQDGLERIQVPSKLFVATHSTPEAVKRSQAKQTLDAYQRCHDRGEHSSYDAKTIKRVCSL